MLVIDITKRIKRKYGTDAGWLIIMNGCSTGCPSIHVSVNRYSTSNQNRNMTERPEYYVLLFLYMKCK